MIAGCEARKDGARGFVAHGVSAAIVAQIERRVVMPSGAARLGAYDRYYARSGDADVIEGVFLQRDAFPVRIEGAVALPGASGAYAVERLPVIFDGMCAVLNAEFHLSALGLAPPAPRDPLLTAPQAQTVTCGGL